MIWNDPTLVNLKPKTLEDYSWDEISAVSRAGKAAEYWKLGDTKSILFNGSTYCVQIIGFDHDNVVDVASYGRNKAGVTFQFGKAKSNVEGQYGMYSQYYSMNGSKTNTGGWTSCVMRSSTMPTMKTYLPTDCQGVICKVNKLTSAGGGSSSINTTQDELWLLSEIEIFGKTTYSVSGEGEQYAFYKSGNNRFRYNKRGSTERWWERSPNADGSNYFCIVDGSGFADYSGASVAYGVSFGFCV